MTSTKVRRVGIVGAGIMGAGVAEVAAKSGHEVILRSRSQATADATVAALDASLTRQVAKGKLEDAEREAALARGPATADLADLGDCDLVLESVVEDLAVKRELFRELDLLVRADAILATNTSTLPVMELAAQTNRPERV